MARSRTNSPQNSNGEAVERIRTLEATGMTPQALHALSARAAALDDELADLRAQVSALPTDAPPADLDADEAFALREQRATHVSRLEQEVASMAGQLSRLRVTLRDTPAPESPPPQNVRLPDPRPAPPGAQPTLVLCRFGRVLVIDYDRLSQELESGLQTAVGRPSGYLRLTPSDHAWIVNYFQTHTVGSRWLRWVIFDRGPRELVARLAWREPAAGETPEQMQRMDSAWRRALRSLDPRRRYLRFYVWSDSFEPYLRARSDAEGRGFTAWWEALDPSEEYEGNIYQAALSPRALVD
jgi:hypothetical protein